MKVPLINIIRQNSEIKNDLISIFENAINDGYLINGPEVEIFEKNFALTIGTRHSHACANGTDALYAAIKYMIKPGDEVIVPAMTWIATAAAVTEAGGKPVFCDIDMDTYTICPLEITRKITKKTRGIIPVHLYGHPCAMDEILEIAEAQSLWVIEDCAQAHLATYKNKPVGSIGLAGTFSFFPSKNLGSLGDSGAITTNDEDLYLFVKKYMRHGALKKNEHEIIGINSRMDTIQAGFLNIKLNKLSEWTERRIESANYYNSILSENLKIKLPETSLDCKHVYHLYSILVNEKRDELLNFLNSKGVGAQINYPKMIPALVPYFEENNSMKYPNAYKLQSELICLPLCSHITKNEIEYTCDIISKFYEE